MSDPTPRNSKGHWLEKPEAAKPYSITSENAAEMARKRWEKYREAAADAVVERIKTVAPNATTPEAAWGVLNARLAVQIMKSDKPRGRDLDSLGQNIGARPNDYERSEPEKNSGDAGIWVASTALTELLGILRDVIQPREIIEGKVNDTRTE
jgi:hypothetical protein